MIQVRLLVVRFQTPQGIQQENMDVTCYINPARIDTVTCLEQVETRKQQHLPDAVRSVIRYDDPTKGYRLMYVAQTAYEVARARRREILGEDSDTTDFGNLRVG